MIVNDFHVHFGKFREHFFDADTIEKYVNAAGINKFGIMPTSTTGTHDYAWEIAETLKIMKLLPDRAIPYLRVYPEMLEKSHDLTLYDELPFKLIKIHGYAHDWHTYPSNLERMFAIARERNLPMLFHTGGRTESDAGQYLNLVKKYTDVTVVLAHGRPINQAIKVLLDCNNVYVDTAFMPTENIAKIVEYGLERRIVFGTDYPINIAFYNDIAPGNWHKDTVRNLVKQFGETLFKLWSNHNFNSILDV